ncbi:outer membrane beta-barrel protein [Acidithiobacillus montserratensis]|uniref:Outer membrane beta-barrel protein n=1 Tax=Acidithiobacillus montserratensis TaxID=2729135 RepID=A0ACD5HH37_9PROT|nr:outer membrane beta-barrel protein [Acidithiobacillus montserratensis]MBN2679261.1 outer membrane beta-barrel protein [Acidithiobacillaceae bacterium]MBU2747676.1 outer membrane beta-barrel protein [Acidithiobacillus montserratensis]
MIRVLGTLLALAMLALAVPAGAAEPAAHDQTYVNLFGGNTFFSSASGLAQHDSGPVLGLRLGQRLDGHLGVEAQVAAAFAHLQNTAPHSGTTDANQFSGALLGNVYAFNSPNTPYLSLGLGASSNLFNQDLGRGTSLMGVFGLGYQYSLSDHIGLRLDVQDQLLFDSPTPNAANLNNIQVTGGISYFWGGSKKAPFPVIGPSRP